MILLVYCILLSATIHVLEQRTNKTHTVEPLYCGHHWDRPDCRDVFISECHE